MKMKEICKNLMPPEEEEISEVTIKNCLSLVSHLNSGSGKKIVKELY